MPDLPAHAASWRGPSLMLDLTGHVVHGQQQRRKLAVHSNMLVGQLRRLVAAKVDLPACKARLFFQGA